jgi:hypothetical protein
MLHRQSTEKAMAKKQPGKKTAPKKKDAAGIKLEKIVARIQQMMDSNSTVMHNEKLLDRVGNTRQYDVVIRGQFGGRPVLGVMECKDHSRPKGADAVEAFAKKTENLGANLRIMVSRKGFTKQALKVAKHDNIGCLSLLPDDPKQVGFSIGDWWYGVIRLWTNIRFIVHFDLPEAPVPTFDVNSVKWGGKPLINWHLKELYTTYQYEEKEGECVLKTEFSQTRLIEIEGKEYPVKGILCVADRIFKKKRRFVSWSGDAFFDWEARVLTIPDKGVVVGSAVESDLSAWPDYDGVIPDSTRNVTLGFIHVTVYDQQTWDAGKDDDVPDVANL